MTYTSPLSPYLPPSRCPLFTTLSLLPSRYCPSLSTLPLYNYLPLYLSLPPRLLSTFSTTSIFSTFLYSILMKYPPVPSFHPSSRFTGSPLSIPRPSIPGVNTVLAPPAPLDLRTNIPSEVSLGLMSSDLRHLAATTAKNQGLNGASGAPVAGLSHSYRLPTR